MYELTPEDRAAGGRANAAKNAALKKRNAELEEMLQQAQQRALEDDRHMAELEALAERVAKLESINVLVSRDAVLGEAARLVFGTDIPPNVKARLIGIIARETRKDGELEGEQLANAEELVKGIADALHVNSD